MSSSNISASGRLRQLPASGSSSWQGTKFQFNQRSQTDNKALMNDSRWGNMNLYQSVFVGNAFKFFIPSCIQFPQYIWIKKLWEEMLPDEYHKEERHWEQDTLYWYPCYAEAYQEVNQLKYCEGGYCPGRHGLHKRCMRTFKNPVNITRHGSVHCYESWNSWLITKETHSLSALRNVRPLVQMN